MDTLVVAVFGGLGSGLVVAATNFYFTRRFLDERLRKEQASRWKENARTEKLKVVMDLFAHFEDVRVNYQRLREGKPIDPKFELHGAETVALTNIARDLRLYRPLMSDTFHQRLSQQLSVAGELAVAIKADDAAWRSAMEKWDQSEDALREAIEKDFYRE